MEDHSGIDNTLSVNVQKQTNEYKKKVNVMTTNNVMVSNSFNK